MATDYLFFTGYNCTFTGFKPGHIIWLRAREIIAEVSALCPKNTSVQLMVVRETHQYRGKLKIEGKSSEVSVLQDTTPEVTSLLNSLRKLADEHLAR